ncbi:MAG: hypothetical protein SFX73_34715 [Kofleriaceae bacterium]|nr:hypothetical protein [Kofleriaceae bacterium]
MTTSTKGTRVQLDAQDHEQIAVEIQHSSVAATTACIHDVELYLFIPRNVGLTSANYPSSEFYNDLTTYLRLDLPEIELDDLRTLIRSPLRTIEDDLARLANGLGTADPIATAVKLFGHEFTEAVRRERKRLRHKIRAGARREGDAQIEGDVTVGAGWRSKLLADVTELAVTARSALKRLRETKRRFSPFRRVAPEAWEVFQRTDEYASLFLDGALAGTALEIEAHPVLFDGSGWTAHVLQVLSACATDEAAYRHAQGFVNLDGGSETHREYFLYRRSLLKKAVQQALWVETRRRPADNYVRNAAGMVAASLAATWAVIAQLPTRMSALSSSTQTLMFALPVVAYVAKDRIKELTKEWLIRRMRAFDQETELVGSHLEKFGLGRLRGRLRERVRFINEAPDDVAAARRRSRWIAGAHVGGESILLYRRQLELAPAPKGTPTDDTSFRQIIRLSLRHFMTRLDDRDQAVHHYSPTAGTFARHSLAKVYHLNVVARVSTPGGEPMLKRWRVVFSRAGIERIEAPE